MALEGLSGVIESRMKADGRVRSACCLCQNFCGMVAHVKDGQIFKVEGDPDNPRNMGHMCAKGLSGFLNLYSPGRVKAPLLRTNPEKSPGVDPGWREISWEEALSLVAEKVRAAKLKDDQMAAPATGGGSAPPYFRFFSQRIMVGTFDHWASHGSVMNSWAKAANAYVVPLAANTFCGNSVHPPSILNTSTFEITVDPEYSKYILLIGAQAGSIIHYDTMKVARHISELRPGNVKVVVVDPMAGYSASKAEMWIPIRPGTDIAFILGLVNLLVNEDRVYDSWFLKNKTNAPYLIGEDGRYLKLGKGAKPMIYDPVDEAAKAFDDPTIKDFALEGSYAVDGVACRPAFDAIKEHVRRYTPEYVETITTIPRETIKQVARELGEAACIGKTITIDGKELPYRPVSICWYRGLSAHKHAYLGGMAAMMLPTLLGAVQVPGGIHGAPRYEEYVTEEGMMASKSTMGSPYPPRPVPRPRRVDAFELFPISYLSTKMIPSVLRDPGRFGIDTESFIWPEVMFIYRDNVVKNSTAPEKVVEGFRKVPFVVSLNIDLDETANSLADLVLPELHHLEKVGETLFNRIDEPGYWYAAKPVVKPPFNPFAEPFVSTSQIFLEIARRAGFLGDVYATLNGQWNLTGTSYELDPTKQYTYQELMDRRLKSWLGKEKGLEWLMSDDGGLLVWGASVEEKHRGAFRKGRIHLYYEFMIPAKQGLEETLSKYGIEWDTSDYQPIPDWKPCSSYTKRDDKFGLYLINYKVPMVAHSVGRFNPISKQLVGFKGHIDSVLIHPETAAKLGISHGDSILVETAKGRKQRGIAYLSERVQLDVIASSQAKFKGGIDFNYLATLEDDTMDYLTGAVDACLLVRITKEEPQTAVPTVRKGLPGRTP